MNFCVALSLAGIPVISVADSASAARYYEDGLARYKKDDVPGAIIQLKNALQQDNKLLAAHVLLGKALLRSGNPPAAEAAFNEALKLGVSRSEVYPSLGRALLQLGQPKQIIEKLNPDDLPVASRVEVLSIRGIAYAEQGNYPAAARSFETARGLDPNSLIPLVSEIPVLLTQAQIDRAKALSEKAIAIDPNSADAWNMHASTAHAALDVKTALERYSKALQLDPLHVDARIARASILLDFKRDAEAAKDLEELRKLVPDEARVAYLRAVIAGRQGKTAEVQASLKKIVEVVDALPASWLATREQFLMLGGVGHHGLGEFVKARAYLESVVNLNSRNLGARKLLASIYLDSKDYASVERTLDPILRGLPNDPQTLYLMGQMRLAQKRYVQASEMLDRALKAGGDSAEVRAAIGFTQLGLGEGAAGIKSLELAFARKPGDPKVGLALATQYLGSNQGAKAIPIIDAVAKAEPENLATRNAQGAVHAAAGDLAGARKIYEGILAKDANFAPTVLNFAKLERAEGRTEDARKRLGVLLSRMRDDDNAMYEMGQLEQAIGRRAEALRWFEQAFLQRKTNVRAGISLVDAQLGSGKSADALKTAKDLVDANRGNIDALSALSQAQLSAGDRPGLLQTLKELTTLAEYDALLQLRIGRMQLLAGNADGAAWNAQKSLAAAPNNLGAMSLMADAELTRKAWPKAESLAHELQTRYPKSAEGFRIAGDLATARGNAAAAADAYRAAFDREPSTIAVQRVVHAQLLGKDPGKAQDTINAWLAKHPTDLGARAALAEVHMRTANWKGAREQYEKVLAARRDDVGILNNLATVLQKLRDPTAMSVAERAWKLAPQDPNVIDTYGWSQAQAGQYDAALRLLRDARLRNPENLETRYHLAWTLGKMGRKAEAREELAPVLKAGTAFDAQEEARVLSRELGG
ncbi:MAG: PEP-CTERM system TPR-repeat protein PrsT [Rhodocyclaceae bacterium]